jgi:hypothetical protein
MSVEAMFVNNQGEATRMTLPQAATLWSVPEPRAWDPDFDPDSVPVAMTTTATTYERIKQLPDGRWVYGQKDAEQAEWGLWWYTQYYRVPWPGEDTEPMITAMNAEVTFEAATLMRNPVRLAEHHEPLTSNVTRRVIWGAGRGIGLPVPVVERPQ